MNDFSNDQLELINNAVRYYQMNGVIVGSSDYRHCAQVLTKLTSVINEIERRRNALCDT
jgi:hypothetical protein